MTDHERHQADLLDGYINDLDGGHSTPPDELDPALASVAVMLAAELTPPEPSARFVRRLDQRLTAGPATSNNHHQAVIPAMAGTELAPQTTPAGWREAAVAPRRSRLAEFARLATAVLAIMLIGSALIFMFSDRDETLGPGAGDTPREATEILVSWDPHGVEDYKLFVVHTDTGEVRKLTPGPAEADSVSERYANWSPDGQYIAFVRLESSQAHLMLTNASGGGLSDISAETGISDVSAFSWSPDGTQLAVRGKNNAGTYGIHLINADGSEASLLIADGDGIGNHLPAWSPDGQQVAFIRSEGRSPERVYVIDIDELNATPITDGIGAASLNWSPDGSRIAVTAGRIRKSVLVMNADGSGLQRLTHPEAVVLSPAQWSPDGNTLAFAFSDPALSSEHVMDSTVVARLDGLFRPLTEIAGVPEWSPDGTQVAILTAGITEQGMNTHQSSLYLVNEDGSNLYALLEDVSLAYDPPVWRPISDPIEPQPAPTPTPQSEPTPTLEPSPTVAVEGPDEGIPGAWLISSNERQQGVFAYGCGWPGFNNCVGPRELTFPQDTIEVPQGTIMTFSIDGMTGEDLANFRANAFNVETEAIEELQGKPYIYLPSTDEYTLPVNWSPTELTMTADLPHGEYVVGVYIGMPFEDDPPPVDGFANRLTGIATYGFHIRVTDGQTDIPPPVEPERFEPVLTYGNQTQAGVFAYGCNWEGNLVCVDPGGLKFPADSLVVPEGATMYLTFSNPADIEIVRFDGRIHLTDDAEIRQGEVHSELLYPAPHEATPIMWGSLEDLNVVADLPPGFYVLAVTYDAAQGSGTYGFNINVMPVEEPSRVPDTIGTITEVRQQGEDLSILIVEHPENPNAGDQMFITVRPDSRVFERTEDGVQRRSSGELQVGMHVTVAITGTIASSYPGYAYGSEVVIVRTETDGPRDPNDLVTMTFRHSQITGFSAIPGGDRLYVAYSITGGASGEVVLCAHDEPGAETCASGYEFRAEVDVPRGAELDFTVYRFSRDNPDEPEVVKQGREVVDADMITRSHYRYGASNPGGY